MASFKVETEHEPGKLLMRLFGEFDLLAFDEVDGLLSRAQLDGSPDVIVDLRGVDFIDSSGIRVLILAHRRAEEAGGCFRLVRGSEAVQRVFEIAGLDTRLPFQNGSDE